MINKQHTFSTESSCWLLLVTQMPVDYTELSSLYYNPTTGLRSAKSLYERLKPRYTIQQITAWLKDQSTHQRFTERKRPKPFYPMSRGQVPFSRCQQDLLDVRSYNSNKNSGIQYLLLTIDAFSKYLVCVPVKSKSNTDLIPALDKTIESICHVNMGFPPSVIDSDNEPAFTSHQYKQVLADDNIEQVLTPPEDHLALSFIDRASRTVRSLISHYREMAGSSTYINALPDLIANYNSSYRRTIGVSPNQAAQQTHESDRVINADYKQRARASKQAWAKDDIQVGSEVRTILPRQLFDKLTRARFSNEIHIVDRIVGGIFYYVQGEPDRRYRKYELLLVNNHHAPPADAYRDEEDDEKGDVDEEDSDYAVQRRVERRIAREGFQPHRYNGSDPDNSLEARYMREVAELPPSRRRVEER